MKSKEALLYASCAYTLFGPLYSIYMFRYIKKNPAYRTAGMRRMTALPIISGCMMLYSFNAVQGVMNDQIDRYVKHLNDDQLNNFTP